MRHVEWLDVDGLDLWLDVNGRRRQSSNTKNLIFGVGELTFDQHIGVASW